MSRAEPRGVPPALFLGDTLAVADIALDAYDRARPPKRLVTLNCNHSDPYSGPLFEPNVTAQRDWFVEHLKP